MALEHPFGPKSALPGRAHARTRESILHACFGAGFPYSMKLTGHTSCVNALAFSRGEGRWLASAGDDCKVLLWDLHQSDVTAPSCSFGGPRANVFTVDFSASNRFVYSAGVDAIICKFDISRGAAVRDGIYEGEPAAVYNEHEDNIRAVSCHPFQDEVFLSASEDGSVQLHDGRAESRQSHAQSTLQQAGEFTDVQFHPRMEHIFVTSDAHGNVCLRDTRMAFGPLHQRTKKGVVRTYATMLARRTSPSYFHPDASSVRFNADGSKMAVIFLHYLPTIYSVSDPLPLAVCSGRNLPDGNPPSDGMRSYSNCCSIKHGSFGAANSSGSEYFSTGSDDFRGYIWKVPSLSALEEQRREIDNNDWLSNEYPNVTAFTDGILSHPKYVPVELSTPTYRLHGHRSIINTALIHPVHPIIATSGIERHVFMHSPTAASPFSPHFTLTSTDVRVIPPSSVENQRRFLQALTGQSIDLPDDELGEDGGTIALFDEIIRQEGDSSDIFASARRVNPRLHTPESSDSESEEADTDEGSDSAVSARAVVARIIPDD